MLMVDFSHVIRMLVEDKRSLSREQSRDVVGAMLDQRFDDLEVAATLVALSQKGETADEIAGAADAILARHPPFSLNQPGLLNIGGTGGDRAGTFNISTTAAFVVAAAGVPVVKHGNRGVTSASGSSDLMAALCIDVAASSEPDRIRADLRRTHFAYVATSAYYRFPASLGALRRRIAVRSIFNLAGPLVHPCGVQFQIVGVARPSLMGPMAQALVKLGGVTAFVVHGVDGLDEVSCVGETLISKVEGGAVDTWTVRPEDFGVQPCRMSELRGGDPRRNAEICIDVLAGHPGPYRDATIVVAGAALVLAGQATSFREAAAVCGNVLDTGRAHRVLETFRKTER